MHNLKRLKKLELEKDASYIIFNPSLKTRDKEIVTIRLEIIRKDILKNRIKAKKAKVQLLNEENYPEINFDKFKSIPLLTETDIANEEKRLKEIGNKLFKAWKEVSSFEDKVKNTMVLARFD